MSAADASTADELGAIPAQSMGPVTHTPDPGLEDAINMMLDRISTNFDQRQQWLATQAHDLRSPLTAIIANAELAMDDLATPEDLTYAVNVAHRNATRLAELIDAFMDEANSHKP